MFCSKCGTQLPDGAMFCTSCGNPLNNQPTSPMMPAEPIAPVMDAPMMDAPVMDAPAFNPAGQYPYNNVPNNMPYDMQNNMFGNPAPKKSKAPLFIGLGIATLVVAIIAIVLILVLSGKDDDKKGKTNNNTTKTEITTPTAETTTEKETTTEEPTTSTNVDINYEDAKDVVEKYMSAIASEKYSKASKYILPAFLEVSEDNNISAEILVSVFTEPFLNPNGDLLDYEVKYAFAENDYYYNTFLEKFDETDLTIEDQPSYSKPLDYATVEVKFMYEEQVSFVYFYLAFVDDNFYIFEIDTRYFSIDFDSTSPSVEQNQFDFEKSLAENYITFSQPIEGNVTTFGDHTLTIPSDWILATDGLYYHSTQISCVGSRSLSTEGFTKVVALELLCESYMSEGFTNLEFGNLTANDKTGYYIEADYLDEHLFIMIFFNEAEDTAYIATTSSYDATSESYDLARAICASLEIQ